MEDEGEAGLQRAAAALDVELHRAHEETHALDHVGDGLGLGQGGRGRHGGGDGGGKVVGGAKVGELGREGGGFGVLLHVLAGRAARERRGNDMVSGGA